MRASSPHGWTGVSIVVLLGIMAFGLLWQLGVDVQQAPAQTTGQVGGPSRDVFVTAGQISRETYGLYMVDYKNQTICVYQFLPQTRKLRLMAARTYRYDVQLDEYNADAPRPAEVKKLIQMQRRK